MNIQLVDLTLHIDENLDAAQRETVEDSLRAIDGVISIHNAENTPHLTVVQYNPDETDSQAILQRVTNQGAHAQLIGM